MYEYTRGYIHFPMQVSRWEGIGIEIWGLQILRRKSKPLQVRQSSGSKFQLLVSYPLNTYLFKDPGISEWTSVDIWPVRYEIIFYLYSSIFLQSHKLWLSVPRLPILKQTKFLLILSRLNLRLYLHNCKLYLWNM